jgi:threonine/homoserine/homoserine lactone efflux protein
MVWSGSARLRGRRGVDVRRVYYSILAVFVAWGCIALNLAQPLTLVVIGANVAGVNFVFLSIHTLVVNRKVLPRELRPPVWREVMVALCALFFGGFAVVTIVSRL